MTKHQCLDHGEVAFCDGCLVDSLHHEISQLKAQLNNMEACYIEKKKQVDRYGRLTTSIRNEFDLWSDDSEFADVIEAQIENLEALRGTSD